MKFAKRMQKSLLSPSLAIAQRVRELRLKGESVINFGTRPDVPQHIKDAAISSLHDGGSTSYTDVRGLSELRYAIAEKLADENNLEVDPDQEIVVTVGAKQAIHAALIALVEEGDEVLVEDPGWVSFAPIVNLSGATPVPIPLHTKDGLVFNFDEIRGNINSSTRVLLLCNPHNPTGSVYDEAALMAISKIACEHDLIVIADEAYERLVYEQHKHISIASMSGMRERTLTVQTTSKVYNMGGWRVGWISGPSQIIDQIVNVQSNLVSCTPPFSQWGAAAALGSPIGMGGQLIEQLIVDLSKRRDFVKAGLESISGVTCPPALGGFFMFPNISKFGLSSEEFSNFLLDQAGVAVVPGSAFGNAGEGHVRILFTSTEAELEKGLNRITTALSIL